MEAWHQVSQLFLSKTLLEQADCVAGLTLHSVRSFQLLGEELERHDHDNYVVWVAESVAYNATKAALVDVSPSVHCLAIRVASLAVVRRQIRHSEVYELLQDLQLRLRELKGVTSGCLAVLNFESRFFLRFRVAPVPQ